MSVNYSNHTKSFSTNSPNLSSRDVDKVCSVLRGFDGGAQNYKIIFLFLLSLSRISFQYIIINWKYLLLQY